MTNQKVLRAHDFPATDVFGRSQRPHRCRSGSRAALLEGHIHHLIAGTVRGVRPLPSLWLGRRRLILRASFDEWVRANEQHPQAML